jgi:hypothetical protein
MFDTQRAKLQKRNGGEATEGYLVGRTFAEIRVEAIVVAATPRTSGQASVRDVAHERRIESGVE